MPEILNYAEFLRTDDDSLPRASREVTTQGLTNLRKGMRKASQQQLQQQGVSVNDMNESKGVLLDFIDQLSEIQNKFSLLDHYQNTSKKERDNGISSDATTRLDPVIGEYFDPEIFNVNDINELAYGSPSFPHLINDDSEEDSDEDDFHTTYSDNSDDDSTVVIHPRHRQQNGATYSKLITRTTQLANKAKTYFRIKVKPIFNQLSADDISNVNNEIDNLKRSVITFNKNTSSLAKKMLDVVTNLIEVVLTAGLTYTKSGPEIFGGSMNRTQMKTAPTRFSSIFHTFDRKHML